MSHLFNDDGRFDIATLKQINSNWYDMFVFGYY